MWKQMSPFIGAGAPTPRAGYCERTGVGLWYIMLFVSCFGVAVPFYRLRKGTVKDGARSKSTDTERQSALAGEMLKMLYNCKAHIIVNSFSVPRLGNADTDCAAQWNFL